VIAQRIEGAQEMLQGWPMGRPFNSLSADA
jgi:hypothetical protein